MCTLLNNILHLLFMSVLCQTRIFDMVHEKKRLARLYMWGCQFLEVYFMKNILSSYLKILFKKYINFFFFFLQNKHNICLIRILYISLKYSFIKSFVQIQYAFIIGGSSYAFIHHHFGEGHSLYGNFQVQVHCILFIVKYIL